MTPLHFAALVEHIVNQNQIDVVGFERREIRSMKVIILRFKRGDRLYETRVHWDMVTAAITPSAIAEATAKQVIEEFTKADGHCPKCGANGWVLNRDPNHPTRCIDVCGQCGYSEESEVIARRRAEQRRIDRPTPYAY